MSKQGAPCKWVLYKTMVFLLLLDDTSNHTNSSKEVTSSAVLRSLQVNVGPDGEETRAQTVQKSPEFLSTPESPSLLQDLQPSDSTSFILLNLTRAGRYAFPFPNCPCLTKNCG